MSAAAGAELSVIQYCFFEIFSIKIPIVEKYVYRSEIAFSKNYFWIFTQNAGIVEFLRRQAMWSLYLLKPCQINLLAAQIPVVQTAHILRLAIYSPI